jgi:hypothetical protein
MHFTILAIAATPVDACRYIILFRPIQSGGIRLEHAVREQPVHNLEQYWNTK